MEPEQPGTTTRRQLITGGIVLAGGAVAGVATADSAAAATGQPMILGTNNQADATTSLQGTGPGPAFGVQAPLGPAVVGNAPQTGLYGISGTMDPNEPNLPAGVFGLADQAPGVAGQGPAVGVLGLLDQGPVPVDFNQPFLPAAVYGHTVQGVGVAGHSDQGTAVVGDADQGTGVFGHSVLGSGVIGIHREGEGPPIVDANDPNLPAGVFGLADEGTGILGSSLDGTGILGLSHQLDFPAVEARNLQPGGVGLAVDGRVLFSSVGQGVIPKGRDEVHIVDPIVSFSSQIFVTLCGDPGGGCCVQFIGFGIGEFDVHLTKKVKQPVPFVYLVTG